MAGSENPGVRQNRKVMCVAISSERRLNARPSNTISAHAATLSSNQFNAPSRIAGVVVDVDDVMTVEAVDPAAPGCAFHDDGGVEIA